MDILCKKLEQLVLLISKDLIGIFKESTFMNARNQDILLFSANYLVILVIYADTGESMDKLRGNFRRSKVKSKI